MVRSTVSPVAIWCRASARDSIAGIVSGASGFSYYSGSDFHDMQYFVSIADAMRLLVPYEDLIIDGALAPLTSSSGCVASAMGLSGTYLIGVTPLNSSAPVMFAFRAANAGPHELVDVGLLLSLS